MINKCNMAARACADKDQTFPFVLIRGWWVLLSGPFSKWICRWRWVVSALATSEYPSRVWKLIWQGTLFFLVAVLLAQRSKLHMVSIRVGTNRLPETEWPEFLSVLVLSCPGSVTAPPSLHPPCAPSPGRWAVPGPHPSKRLWACCGGNTRAALAAPRAIAFHFEGGMFHKHVCRHPVPKTLHCRERVCETKRILDSSVLDRTRFQKALSQDPVWLPGGICTGSETATLVGGYPPGQPPWRVKEETQGRLESFERTSLDRGTGRTLWMLFQRVMPGEKDRNKTQK